MTKIGVSVLAADYSILGAQIKKLEKAGADIISFDVMDGHFVNNITVGPAVINSCRTVTNLPFECHLMIEKPERYIGEFLSSCDIITIHIESTRKLAHLIKLVKHNGKKVCVALKPRTPAKAVLPYLNGIDMVLVMTVEPGFAGRRFMDMTAKIKTLKTEIKKRGLNVSVMVDGGINDVTAALVKKAGADILISASYILTKDYKKAIETLRYA